MATFCGCHTRGEGSGNVGLGRATSGWLGGAAALSVLAVFVGCTSPEVGHDPRAVERVQSKLGVTPGDWSQLGPGPMQIGGRNILPGGVLTTSIDVTGAVHRDFAKPHERRST